MPVDTWIVPPELEIATTTRPTSIPGLEIFDRLLDATRKVAPEGRAIVPTPIALAHLVREEGAATLTVARTWTARLGLSRDRALYLDDGPRVGVEVIVTPHGRGFLVALSSSSANFRRALSIELLLGALAGGAVAIAGRFAPPFVLGSVIVGVVGAYVFVSRAGIGIDRPAADAMRARIGARLRRAFEAEPRA